MRIRMHWGTGMACVYGLFACSTLGFVAFAMSQPVELVSADYYQQSLEQDRRMEAVVNVGALGAAFAFTAEASARSVTVRVPASMQGVVGTVTFYRPSDAAADRQVPFAPVQGQQRVSTEALSGGHWIVKVDWTASGRPFYHEAIVDLP